MYGCIRAHSTALVSKSDVWLSQVQWPAFLQASSQIYMNSASSLAMVGSTCDENGALGKTPFLVGICRNTLTLRVGVLPRYVRCARADISKLVGSP